jgi:hypothetical protein
MDDKSVETGRASVTPPRRPPQRRVRRKRRLAKQAKLFSKPHGKLGPRQEASGVADDMLTTARHATQAASRQVDEQPLMAAIVGFTLGYIAALLVHGRR